MLPIASLKFPNSIQVVDGQTAGMYLTAQLSKAGYLNFHI